MNTPPGVETSRVANPKGSNMKRPDIKRKFQGAIAVLFSVIFLANSAVGYAAFNDDPNDSDNDSFTNGEETLMGTNPNSPDSTLNDIALITLLQKRNFDYFWQECQPPYYFAPDRAQYDQTGQGSAMKSIAGTGFAITSIVAADRNGWVDHVQAYNRIKTLLTRLREMQNSGDATLSKHGFFYHFVDAQGRRYMHNVTDGSELSSVDHALLLAGVMTAGQFYKGTEVEVLAREIYENTDWPFLFDGAYFYHAWLPNAGNTGPIEGGTYFQERWDEYAEQMVLLLQGIGSPTHPVSALTWKNFGIDWANYGGSPWYAHRGPLFTHQFSHAWVDFRNLNDPGRGMMQNGLIGSDLNYFNNSVTATLVNRHFCVDKGAQEHDRYNTYGPNSWGISSADASDGYRQMEPDMFTPVPETVEYNCDSGTVVPDAALGSIAFTPSESIAAAQNWFSNLRDQTFGRYGFRNCFNLGAPSAPGALSHFPSSKIGLDSGTIVTMIENFRTGLIWKYFMRNTAIQNAVDRSGLVREAVPSLINFDNQASPGRDPNSFGGFSGSFGTGGNSSCVSISTVNASVGGYVWRIAGAGYDSGAFNTLAAKDIGRQDTLTFWLKGAVGGEQVNVGLKDVSGTEYGVSVSDYIDGGTVTTDYKEVRIPLDVFSERHVRLTAMDNISLRFMSGQGGEIYVDAIAFVQDVVAPLAPANVRGTISGSDVDLMWNQNEQRDVVGYNVYRAISETGPFTKLNNYLVVGSSYHDPGARPVFNTRVYYKVTAVDNAVTPNESNFSNLVGLPEGGPQLDPIGDKTAIAGDLLAFTVSASGVDPSTLNYSASNLPSGASFDPRTRIFSWTPRQDQIGMHRDILFSVTDGMSASSEAITIAVSDNETGTIETSLEDSETGQISSGFSFGEINSSSGLTPAGQVVRLAALSNSSSWKVQVYTDNGSNYFTEYREGPRGPTNSKFLPPPVKVIAVVNRYTGVGETGAGLIGQTNPAYRVPLKWAVFSARIAKADLPKEATLWGTVPDKGDADFGNTLSGRTLLEAGGHLGIFPSRGRSATGPSVFVYFAADFTGAPAQTYSTSQLILELLRQ